MIFNHFEQNPYFGVGEEFQRLGLQLPVIFSFNLETTDTKSQCSHTSYSMPKYDSGSQTGAERKHIHIYFLAALPMTKLNTFTPHQVLFFFIMAS